MFGVGIGDGQRDAFAVLLANEPKWRIKAHYAARRLVQIYLQRKADIEAHRDARLTETGVELPGKPRSPKPEAKAEALPVVSTTKPKDQTVAVKTPVKAPADKPPEPLAKPKAETLPPVPGPVARKPSKPSGV